MIFAWAGDLAVQLTISFVLLAFYVKYFFRGSQYIRGSGSVAGIGGGWKGSTAELRARGMSARQVHDQRYQEVGAPGYPNPAGTGLAYMIAPLIRGYTRAREPVTMNMPHYMFYTPSVRIPTSAGTALVSSIRSCWALSPGRGDYIIMLVGKTEDAKILRESKDLLAELCSYRDHLRTTAATRVRTPVDSSYVVALFQPTHPLAQIGTAQ